MRKGFALMSTKSVVLLKAAALLRAVACATWGTAVQTAARACLAWLALTKSAQEAPSAQPAEQASILRLWELLQSAPASTASWASIQPLPSLQTTPPA